MTSSNTAVAPHRIALMLETDCVGGAEIMLLQFAESLRRRGHHILAVGPRGRDGWLSSEFKRRGFEHRMYELKHPLDFMGFLELRRILAEHRIQIVHSHEYTMAVYGGIAALTLALPYIITMHGDKWSVGAMRRRVAMRWVFRRSEAVVAVSRATHDHMTASLGLAPHAMATVPNGIDFVPGDRIVVRKELGLAESDLLVVAVGNLTVRKGHILLLRAMLCLDPPAASMPWHVAIAGAGPEHETLRAFAELNGIADRVHLLGSREDIPDVLAAADIFTMPSFWEGLPVALLEAMFARKPVIASDVSGIPEAIVNGRDGILTPPGDIPALAHAISAFLVDPSRRETFAAAAQARAEAGFGIGAMTDAYERFYGIRR